ncbi:hypothetical protein Peur_038865 [Populus x canadensis]
MEFDGLSSGIVAAAGYGFLKIPSFWPHHMTAFTPPPATTKSQTNSYFKYSDHSIKRRKFSDYILRELCLGIQYQSNSRF